MAARVLFSANGAVSDPTPIWTGVSAPLAAVSGSGNYFYNDGTFSPAVGSTTMIGTDLKAWFEIPVLGAEQLTLEGSFKIVDPSTVGACTGSKIRVAAFGLYKYDAAVDYLAKPAAVRALATHANLLLASPGALVSAVGSNGNAQGAMETTVFSIDAGKSVIFNEDGGVPVADDFTNFSLEFTKNTIGGPSTGAALSHRLSVGGLQRLWVALLVLPTIAANGTALINGQINVIRRN